MSSFTAEILIGFADIYHGGIVPTHHLFLSENSKPAWILVRQDAFKTRRAPGLEKTVWIPNIENMLEIGILMVAYHILRDEKVVKIANELNPSIKGRYVHFYLLYSKEDEKKLYEVCRALEDFPKIIVTVFNGSSILSQVDVLNEYKMDFEVCLPAFCHPPC
jgi:hypothetical protein